MKTLITGLSSLGLVVLVSFVSLATPEHRLILGVTAVGFVMASVAMGWPYLVDAPGAGAIMTAMLVTGAATIGLTLLAGSDVASIALQAYVLAGSVIAAFVIQFFRRNRTDVVQGLTVTVMGQVIVLMTIGWLWLLAPSTNASRLNDVATQTESAAGSGPNIILWVSVAATATACVVASGPVPEGRRGWYSFPAGTLVGGIVSVVLASSVKWQFFALCLVVSLAVASIAVMVQRLPASSGKGLSAAAAAPVSVAGFVAYTTATLLTATL